MKEPYMKGVAEPSGAVGQLDVPNFSPTFPEKQALNLMEQVNQ